MVKALDLVGQKFGRLIVVERAESKGGQSQWLCKCECGGEKITYGTSLKKGVTQSCGCLHREVVKKKRSDLTGQRFGQLTVISKSSKDEWKCLCECGVFKDIRQNALITGNTRSCGCLKREDLKGKKFGRVTVLEYVGLDETGKRSLWKCVCDCGKEFVSRKESLTKGRTVSCGCFGKEKRLEANTKHGMANTKLYKVWTSMLQRCENPNDKAYEHYGGRGIKVYPKWHEFDGFYGHMRSGYQEGLSLDRIDVNGNYEPGNVRWATRFEQQNNLRNNVRHMFFGELLTCGEAGRKFNINPNSLRSSIYSGNEPEKALLQLMGGAQNEVKC